MATPHVTEGARIGSLRGAAVAEVDRRRLVAALWVTALVALLVGAGVLFAAGARKNAQIESLRARGERVTMTVVGCQGLLGGSGSNPVGYACRGAYRVGGHPYVAAIPGTALHAPHSTLRAVVTPRDPGLVSTPGALAHARPSARVYLVPGLLLAAALAVALGLVARRRRRQSAQARRPAAVTPLRSR